MQIFEELYGLIYQFRWFLLAAAIGYLPLLWKRLRAHGDLNLISDLKQGQKDKLSEVKGV